MDKISEIKRRRTFAIISHPDAGKTTLTEKLLLFGGAIHIAGAVKSNKIKKSATSDFMEIERQRGISVSTSVMGFEYSENRVNILDTPGHEDFAEDTYRTLTAVDSVIIVIDSAKGVETQTRKLMQVCRLRKTPVIVFINKMDREGKDPFNLLEEIEEELSIKTQPYSWPIGKGKDFKGVYNLFEKKLFLFDNSDRQTLNKDSLDISDLSDERINSIIGDKYLGQLKEDIELIDGVYGDTHNLDSYLKGEIAPVLFGSALNNFGIKELLECFLKIAPFPRKTEAKEREIDPFEDKLTGFIFKIHANMDPNHRDKIAFLKICSGVFERNRPYFHTRLKKSVKFSSPTAFMGDKKSIVEIAYPGDIVGISGDFKIGDTLSEGELIKVVGIPSFSPELFRFIENADPLKYKQFAKGVDQLMDEGVAQLFTSKQTGRRIIGTVGVLQFDVIEHRMEHEYGSKCRYEPISLHKACWIESDNTAQLKDFIDRKFSNIAIDKNGKIVFLADSPYALSLSIERFPDIKFSFSSEF